MSSPVIHSGETVSGTVITSTNVAAVEFRIVGMRIRMLRSDAGVWQLRYTVPSIPFWLRKKYTAEIVAMNTAGIETQTPLPISVR